MSNLKTLKPFGKGYDPRRNTKGRPVGSKSLSTELRELMEQKVNKTSDTTHADLMIKRLLHKAAVKGDVRAMIFIWHIIDGKPKVRKQEAPPQNPSVMDYENRKLTEEEQEYKQLQDEYLDKINRAAKKWLRRGNSTIA
jgi:hypothetical protein